MSEAPLPPLSPTEFTLSASIDAASYRERYARDGRVRIANFLPAAAAKALRDDLLAREDWKQVLNSGAKIFELSRSTRAGLAPERAAALDDAVYADAREGFQFRYETIRVPDESEARTPHADMLHRFAQWMSGGEALSLLRSVAGERAIAFADCQATAYWPGDFLTGHDDAVAGKNRHAAYVLSLNPIWRIEWGGLLLMHLPQQRVEGLAPSFATLDIFRVGQPHSVSEVSRSAPGPRLSVTGWLRSR
jgi:SM-20-related protein